MPITYRSIDTMKASRDSGSWTNQQKIDHCNAIARYLPSLTHMTNDCYTNNFGYHSVAYVQGWVDAIRPTGKKIWWRPVFNYTAADAEATLEEIYEGMMEGPMAHPEWFDSGDIFELQPETHPYIGELNGTGPDKAAWNAWLRDKSAAAAAFFASHGKTVITNLVSLTDGYQEQGVLEPETIEAFNNTICVDFYPLDSLEPGRAVRNLLRELSIIRAANPGTDIVISEIGVANTRNPDDVQQREVLRAALNALADLPYIKGLNYWVSFNTSGGGGFTQLFQTNSRTAPQPAIHILEEFYAKGRCTSRMPVL